MALLYHGVGRAMPSICSTTGRTTSGASPYGRGTADRPREASIVYVQKRREYHAVYSHTVAALRTFSLFFYHTALRRE